jgi:hypothetical protein
MNEELKNPPGFYRSASLITTILARKAAARVTAEKSSPAQAISRVSLYVNIYCLVGLSHKMLYRHIHFPRYHLPCYCLPLLNESESFQFHSLTCDAHCCFLFWRIPSSLLPNTIFLNGNGY